MCTFLKIMSWNANGLHKHQEELQVILDMNQIDICLISETHFTNKSYFKLKGYQTYHTVHPDDSARGGSAVLVKDCINHHEASKFVTSEIQATSVKIQSRTYEVTVSSLYSPPRHNIKKDFYKQFLQSLGNKFIVGGDFNAKNTYWGSRLTTTKGKELLAAIQEINCEPLSSGSPTYWPTDPNKIPDLIDFFIIRDMSKNYIKVEDSLQMSSDHSPIILILSENVIYKQTPPYLTNSRTDWEGFKLSLEQRINLHVPLRTKIQLDAEVEKFVVDIQQAAWENTPEIKRKANGTNYPSVIKDLIQEKRKARRKWHQSRSPEDKNDVNRLSSRLKKEIKNWKNDTMSSYLNSLSNDKTTDYSLWKSTKYLKRPITQIPPIRSQNNSWARSNKEKVDVFAQHLENIFQPHNVDEHNIEDIPRSTTADIAITPTSPEEISKIIKNNIKTKKSPGFDLVTGKILINFPRKAVVKLSNLINASFRLHYVPSMWKVAEVIMIQKPGKPPHEASSYRPISLLPILSKVFEKLLILRMNPIIENKKLIPNHQFGFRTKHSTIDQVHRITNVIEKSLEERKVCSVIFLDVAQAFDKVWHQGLIQKINMQLPKSYADILKSYITDRYFRIKEGEEYSELKPISAGVPQGSVLGPILYLLYTNDLPTLEQNTVATFADDTAIMAVGENNTVSTRKLQVAVNKVQEWTKKWRIKLNENKSVHVDFTNKKIVYKPVTINELNIPYSNSAKYLGLTLDAKLRWKPHVKKKINELKLRYKKMYWLMGRHSTLSIANKLLLYNQILKPLWSYGAQLWGCASASNKLSIQRFQNKVLRDIVNAPWYVSNATLHRDLEVDLVDSVIKDIAKSHQQRLQQHVNVEAFKLLNNDGLVRRLRRIKPFELAQ